MTWTMKIRTLPGSPMLAEYVCGEEMREQRCRVTDAQCINPSYCDDGREACCAGDPECQPDGCGRFEALVVRDAAGDPPPSIECPECGEIAERVISAPAIRYWSRPPVPIGYASKSDEKDPRALDTEPLATGKMTRAEWKKWQRGISVERRHQKRLKAGKISKRVQVGGG